MFDIKNINKSWSLFLDRDGVINKRIINDYVKDYTEFEFLNGTLEALKIFNNIFSHIFVVTNQRGISRKIMTENSLEIIHKKMLNEINNTGARVDKIYYCPHGNLDNCNCRKPATGMAQRAKKEFPEIEFESSIMIGDTVHDMQFGKKLEMSTVFIKTSTKTVPCEADLAFDSLYEFALLINKA